MKFLKQLDWKTLRKARHTDHNNDLTFSLGTAELGYKFALGSSIVVEKTQIGCICPIKHGTSNLFQQMKCLFETIYDRISTGKHYLPLTWYVCLINQEDTRYSRVQHSPAFHRISLNHKTLKSLVYVTINHALSNQCLRWKMILCKSF